MARVSRWVVRDPAGAEEPPVEIEVAADAETAPIPGMVGRIHSPTRGRAAVVEVVVEGWRFELEVEDAARAALRERATIDPPAGTTDGHAEVRAIIPGRVVGVMVGQGDVVEPGQPVLVVEAMKMQNELRSPRKGIVERVAVGEGQTIELGDLLIVIGDEVSSG